MPLVAYGSSGESSDDEEMVTNKGNDTNVTLGHQTTGSNVQRTSVTIDLPRPTHLQSNAFSGISTRKLVGSSKIQITLPSLAELEDSSDDDEPKMKKVKPSPGGSGLSSILPKPKSSISTSGNSAYNSSTAMVRTTLTQLVPDRLRIPKPAAAQNVSKIARRNDDGEWTKRVSAPKRVAVQNVPKVDRIDDDGEWTEKSSYFSMPGPSSDDVEDEDMEDVEPLNRLPSVNIAPKMSASDVPVAHETYQPIEQPSSSSKSFHNMQSNEVAFKKKVAAKFGEESIDQIEIVDINVNDHIGQNRDYLKTVSLEKPPEESGAAANPTAKRKHQITYLAQQAKLREVALKNEWAASKVAKNQTRAKYGF